CCPVPARQFRVGERVGGSGNLFLIQQFQIAGCLGRHIIDQRGEGGPRRRCHTGNGCVGRSRCKRGVRGKRREDRLGGTGSRRTRCQPTEEPQCTDLQRISAREFRHHSTSKIRSQKRFCTIKG